MKVNIKPKELNTLIEHLYQYLDENDNREDLRDILIKLCQERFKNNPLYKSKIINNKLNK